MTTYIQTPQGLVNTADITKPGDRMFRNAWILSGDVIDIDMTQAREIWRNKIRVARQPELERLDADFMQALESGDTSLQQAIASQKQALRDATADPLIDTALTTEDLSVVQPAGLTIS